MGNPKLCSRWSRWQKKAACDTSEQSIYASLWRQYRSCWGSHPHVESIAIRNSTVPQTKKKQQNARALTVPSAFSHMLRHKSQPKGPYLTVAQVQLWLHLVFSQQLVDLFLSAHQKHGHTFEYLLPNCTQVPLYELFASEWHTPPVSQARQVVATLEASQLFLALLNYESRHLYQWAQLCCWVAIQWRCLVMCKPEQHVAWNCIYWNLEPQAAAVSAQTRLGVSFWALKVHATVPSFVRVWRILLNYSKWMLEALYMLKHRKLVILTYCKCTYAMLPCADYGHMSASVCRLVQTGYFYLINFYNQLRMTIS